MKTVDEIYQEMRDLFCAKTGRNLREDGDMAVRLYATAAQIYSLYQYNDWVRKQCFPQTATGMWLDYHGQIRGLTRNGALYAEGEIQFTIPKAQDKAVTIPLGTVCMSASGMRFETIEEGAIPAGSTTYLIRARAMTAGRMGNVMSGMITFLTAAPVGVETCTNISAFTGGQDAESDEDFRSRILASFRRLPNGANAAYYEKEALEIDGVAAVRVLPKNRGLGTVDVIISGEAGIPAQELLDSVQERLEETREICVDVQVLSPTTISVPVAVEIVPEEGYTFETVANSVRDTIQQYFDGGLLGENILCAKLGNLIYGIAGVKNYRLTEPAEDVQVSAAELPIAGVVTVESWS